MGKNKAIAAFAAAALIAVSASACAADNSQPAAPVTVTETAESTQDATFLAQVQLIDGVDGTQSDLIEMGRGVCVGVEGGRKTDILQILIDAYGVEDAAKFMHTAISVYCPRELSN